MYFKKFYAFSIFLLFSALWLVVAPIGSGSDDNWHLTMAYCAYGERNGLCQDNEITQNSGVWSKAKGPTQLSTVGTCFRMDYRLSAECNDFKKINLKKSRKYDLSNLPRIKTTRIWSLYSNSKQSISDEINVSFQRKTESIELTAEIKGKDSVDQVTLIQWSNNDKVNPIITILVAPNGGSISFLENGIRKNLLETNFENNDINVLWNESIGSQITSKDSQLIVDSFQNGLVDIWPAYTYGSNNYYKSVGWLASKDVISSAWQMRFFSLALILLVLFQIMYLLDGRSFSTLIFAIILAGMPAGFFLFSTNNPSQWSWISTSFVAAIALFLQQKEKIDHQYIIGSVVFIQALFLASAREDSAISAFVITAGVIFINRVRAKNKNTSVFPFISSFGFAIWNHQNSVGVAIHAGESNLKSILSLLTFDRFAATPGLVASNFGFGGPLNLGGFAWFDIQMPSIVSITLVSVVLMVFFLHTRELRSRSKTIIYGLFIATNLMMLFALISTPDTPPGGFIQPRYILPMVAGVITLALMQNISEKHSLFDSQHNLIVEPRKILRICRDYSPFIIASTISFILIQVRFGNGVRVESNSWLNGVHGYSGSFDFIGKKLLRYEGPDSTFYYSPMFNHWSFFLISTALFVFSIVSTVLIYSSARTVQQMTTFKKSNKLSKFKNS